MPDQLHIVPVPASRRTELLALARAYYAEVFPHGPPFVDGALDPYWTTRGRHPYLIERGTDVIGFALVWTHPDGLHELAEFTILPEWRHKGLGTEAAHRIFSALAGDWVLGVAAQSPGGMDFWQQCLTSFEDAHDITSEPRRTPSQIGSFRFRIAR